MSWIFRSIPVVIYKLESCCKEMNLGLFSIVCGGQLLNLGGFAVFFCSPAVPEQNQFPLQKEEANIYDSYWEKRLGQVLL